MVRYAADTSVPVERSRAEIEKLLDRYGADQIMFARDQQMAAIVFRMADRQVKLQLQLPDKEQFKLTPTGRLRSPTQQQSEWEQACRQHWRALALVVKAKLEAVEAGISTFDDEFLAHIMLADGGTVGDFMVPQVEQMYLTGEMPRMLPLIGAPK